MKVEELENLILIQNLVPANSVIKPAGNGKLRVDPCPSCGHNGCFTIYTATNSYSCYHKGCCQGGKAYKYLQEIDGILEHEVKSKLKELAGVNDMSDKELREIKRSVSQTVQSKDTPQQVSIDYTNLITELYQNMGADERKFLYDRGLTDEIIDKYKLFYAKGISKKDIIYIKDGICIPKQVKGKITGWNIRDLTPDSDYKYIKSKGRETMFNIDYLDTATKGDIIILTEGEFDALSIEQAGYKAISINGTKNVQKFKDELKAKSKENNFIILTAFDNDDAGIEATKEMGAVKITIPDSFKDVNDWLTNDINFKERLKRNIDHIINSMTLNNSVAGYLKRGFVNDIIKNKKNENRKTHFPILDTYLKNIINGLYVIGGLSSLGKTTFIHQLVDQMAQAGEHVLYFSLEQSKFEMVSKSIARETVKSVGGIDPSKGVSSRDIRDGFVDERVKQAIKNYYETAKRFNVIEGNFNTTVNEMEKVIKEYISSHRVQPIVVIDYLQIIPTEDVRMQDKQKADSNVTKLKIMTRDLGIPIFLISSLNRQNYLTPIDYESFKESGGIEYTADVILGLQLRVLREDLFNSQQKIKEKRETIDMAKKATPRELELKCLKNRSGQTGFCIAYDYYPVNDYFEEIE